MNHLTLKIAGEECSLGIIRLSVWQQINEIPYATLELQIPIDNHNTSDSEVHAAVGAIVTGATVVIILDGTTLFSGYLTQKRLLLNGKLWSVQLEARHVLQKLLFLPHSRIFRNQNDKEIMTLLFKQAGVNVSWKTASMLQIQHDQLVQFRASDWQFICNRLFATNCWLLPDAASNGVTIAPLSVPEKASHQLERHAEQSGQSVYEIDLNFDNRYTPSSLSLQGWDIFQQQLSKAQTRNADSFTPWKAASRQAGPSSQTTPPKLKSEYQLAFSHMPETSLGTLSLSWLNHQQLTGVQGRLLLEGTRDFQPGESVALKEFGVGLDGTVMLTGVNQLFNRAEGWRSELLVGRPLQLPEPLPSVQSLHIGTVAEFSADPLDLDRIPVFLPALNLTGESIFARMGKPWASKESGFCFYPEPGDEVVLGFIESDPRYPVILNSLHNPKNKTPFSPDKKNSLKGLVVNKNEVTQQLLINTEEQNITFSAGDALCNVNAQGNLIFNADQQIEIISKNINMKKS